MADADILDSLAKLFIEDAPLHNPALDSNLQSLVDLARSDHGRHTLASSHAVPKLLSISCKIFPSNHQHMLDSNWSSKTFLLYVKLLRNLCAGNSVNQESFVELCGVQTVGSVVQVLIQGYVGSRGGDCQVVGDGVFEESLAIDGLQMVFQLLGNVAGLGELSQARIWEVFFSESFASIAKVASMKVQGPLCMVIYSCCRGDRRRSEELTNGEGACIIATLLRRGPGVVSKGAPSEWLECLICCLCCTKPYFPVLFCELGNSKKTAADSEDPSQSAKGDTGLLLKHLSFTEEQASLLDLLNASLSAQEKGNHSERPSPESHHDTLMHPQSAAFLVAIIENAAVRAASTSLYVLQIPTQSLVADILGLSLSMTRILCVLDERRSIVVPKFVSSGLIPLLLDLLRALGVPDNGRPSITSSQSAERDNTSSDSSNASTAERGKQDAQSASDPTSINMASNEQSSSSHEFESYPRRDVYIGYRRDIVAVVANASHRNFECQEAVRENGGLLLVLQQCMPDTNNPFLREWGLWAIRNLLEGNNKNQSELADLEVRSAVPDARLRDAGMTVELNPETGRPRLVNVTPNVGNSDADEFM